MNPAGRMKNFEEFQSLTFIEMDKEESLRNS